jgi:drug/metabolite transporter (DMT)-like permease
VIAAGIAAALAAAVANAMALVLQAAEARQMPAREAMHASLLRRLAHRPRWLAGTALMLGAGILQVVALALAPIAVVQPMLATSQLVLLSVARLKLGERVGRRELIGSLAIVLGLTAVVFAAPRHSIVHINGRIVLPLTVVGTVAVVLFLVGRTHHRMQLSIVIGAGFAYSWADFASKLLANELSSAQWLGALWAVGVIGLGALAFLEENTALQHRPAITVAPVIGAIKVPLPVLMALWTGVETWGGHPLHIAILLFGLALVAMGAARLGGSETVARASGADTAPAGHRPGEGPTRRPAEDTTRRPAEEPTRRPGQDPARRPGEDPARRPGEDREIKSFERPSDLSVSG